LFDDLGVMMNRVEVLSDSDNDDDVAPVTANETTTPDLPPSTSNIPTSTTNVPLHPQPSVEEIASAMSEGLKWKDKGNTLFARSDFDGATECYTHAIEATSTIPDEKGRAVFFANRAASHASLAKAPEAIEVRDD
jgi:hypothetical protein